jgi:hypothetical protein
LSQNSSHVQTVTGRSQVRSQVATIDGIVAGSDRVDALAGSYLRPYLR